MPVTGEDLAQLIALVNEAMSQPIPGVSLRMFSPSDLDADAEDSAPLPPGVRRLCLAIDQPDGLHGIDQPESVRMVFALHVAGPGPTVQLDAEALLRWASCVESAAGAPFDAAYDLADPATVRALAKDRAGAREVSAALAEASRRINAVADEVRARMADPSTWLPIGRNDAVCASMSLHRMPAMEVRA
ncbi:MAG TPA: hypothetical protein VGU65_12565 [Frateuria sp.]|uniref:hypothetical protein n=1 Tax=Frateuria sp. TaxID=2211372 RepID=UPI002DE47B5A|nr:hypothetical protein [Frateuria sp.]